MLFFAEGFTFRNFLADAFAVFMFVVWFWLLYCRRQRPVPAT